MKKVASLMSEELSTPPWAIPTLLPEGVSLLAGKPKMGKSWPALSLAISIAQGGNALGTLPTNQGAVLYLGLEDQELKLSFDTTTGLWSISAAPAGEKPLSPVRESIISLFAQKDHPLGPAEIAEALGIDTHTVR